MKHWDTFLRIQPRETSDCAPIGDEWCAAMGCTSGAGEVLDLLRKHVLPLVRGTKGLDYFFYLVHDYTSGVPVSPAIDKADYIHLRLVFTEPVHTLTIQSPWEMTKSVDPSGTGFDDGILIGGAEAGHRLIGKASAFVLDLIEAHKSDADVLAVIKNVRQYLHFIANMTQVRVA